MKQIGAGNVFKGREWNVELQNILEHGYLALNNDKIDRLNQLCQDFRQCAERYAK